MKRYLLLLLAAVFVMAMQTSCSKEDEQTVAADDHCYISSFSIGMLKRDIHVTASNGQDSTYSITYSGSFFPMIINNHKMTIENLDSLPTNTHINAALATVTYTGGTLMYRYLSSVDWHEYNEKDSIDFRGPLEFAVYPTDGSAPRIYSVRLHVHQQEGDAFNWTRMADADVLDALTERKLVSSGDKLFMLGKLSNGTTACAWRYTEKNGQWTIQHASGAEQADCKTLYVAASQLLVGTADGAILTSSDGINWTELCAPVSGRKLLGASRNRIYALENGAICSTPDGGQTWTKETLDEDAAKLPVAQVNLTLIEQPNGYERLLLMGQTEGNSNQRADVWAKAWHVDEKEASEVWMYYNQAADNAWLCHLMDPLIVLPYDKGVIALGGATQSGQYEALQHIFYSSDYGLTWKRSNTLFLPAELKGTGEAISATVDSDFFVWLVVGNATYRGRLNKLGFK
ncbi:MAG: hypothetical protein KBT12_04170 [Bacteroidales bacterium]|nr:hypothetical protein [Candidatus Physcousia equi]